MNSYLSLEALAIGAHWFEQAMVFVRVSKSILIMTVGAFTCAQSLVIAAHADDRNQFFESNAVDNFTVPVVEKQGFGFQYFIDTEARKKAGEDPQEKEEAKQLAAQASPPSQLPQSPTNQPNKFESADDVLGAYGDPSEETPVLAQDNAPKPFKAMMAAFQVGDEKLAYGYARQWVRYMDSLRTRTKNVLKATEAAQKSEDLVSGNLPGAEQLKQGLVNENANLAANLDPRAQEILAKARADEAALAKDLPTDSPEAKEIKARQEIRRALAGKIPVDPKGRVDVYIFFSPTDKNAQAFAPVANKIYDRLSSMKGANFAGFSSARLTKEALRRQQKDFGLSFDLMVGDSFAKELQLRQFPAVVFVSPSAGKIIREVGDKPFIFYDELIAAIPGEELMNFRVLMVFSLLAVSVSPALAQENFFVERMKGFNEQQASLSPAKSFANKKLFPPAFSKWNGDPNVLVCREGDKCVDPTYEEIAPGASDREANVNFYGSMAGFEAGMNAEVHVDATIENYLKGKLTLAYITMGLTEPAVAAGLAQSVNYIGNDVNNRLQGEQAFFSQLSYMPEISESLGQAYISCIAKAQREGKKNWMAAQALCSGDTADLTEDKKKFEDDSGGVSTLSFITDPYFNHDRSGPDAERTIYLSEYLFQRDADAGDAGKKMRDAFKEIIGDVQYKLDKPEADKQGTRKLNYTKLAPLMDKTFEQRLREEAEAVHAAMISTFKEICDNPTVSNPTTAFEGDAFLRNEGMWASQMTFPGFAPDSTLMRSLLELATSDFGPNCPDFSDSGPYSYKEVVENPETAPEAARDYLFLSQRIAFGRTYGIYIIAQQYIRRMNSGEFDAFARKAAFELLYEAAGTHDIKAVYEENTIMLRDYLSFLGDRTARRKQFMKPKGLPRGQGNGNEGSQQTSGAGTSGLGGTD